MKVHDFFKFSALGSISQEIMSNAFSLYMTQLAGKVTMFNNLPKLTALN